MGTTSVIWIFVGIAMLVVIIVLLSKPRSGKTAHSPSKRFTEGPTPEERARIEKSISDFEVTQKTFAAYIKKHDNAIVDVLVDYARAKRPNSFELYAARGGMGETSDSLQAMWWLADEYRRMVPAAVRAVVDPQGVSVEATVQEGLSEEQTLASHLCSAAGITSGAKTHREEYRYPHRWNPTGQTEKVNIF